MFTAFDGLSERPDYLVYLLRCWRESGVRGKQGWRFSLEGLSPEERRGFGSLDDLVGFLRRRLSEGEGLSSNDGG